MDPYINLVSAKYMRLEIDFLRDTYFCTNRNNYGLLQTGGASKEVTHEFKDGTKTYHLPVTTITYPEMTRIIIYSDKEEECVTVIIYKGETDAILHNMSYYEGCATEGLTRPGGGTVLLRFIYRYLLSVKNKFKINKIVLKDTSYIFCEQCPHSIFLARLNMITHGHTWYTKYGFLPYDPQKKLPDDKLIKAYELNKKAVVTLKTVAINFGTVARKLSADNKDVVISWATIKKLIYEYPLMQQFLKRLVTEYDKYCCVIHYVLEEIYDPTPPKKPLLYDMYQKTFYLEI